MLVTLWSSVSVPKRNYIAIYLTSYRISAGLHLLLNNSCTLKFIKKIASDFRQFNKTFATYIKFSFLATLAIGRPSPALKHSTLLHEGLRSTWYTVRHGTLLQRPSGRHGTLLQRPSGRHGIPLDK